MTPRHLAPWVLLCMTAAACDDREADGPGPDPSGARTEPATTLEPVPEPEPAPSYEVHEWGLVSLTRTDGDGAYVTGPGRFRPRPRPQPSGVPALSAGQFSIRKPVLYVHLADGVDEVTFDATVSIDGGEIREHWPLVEDAGPSRVAWAGVTATRGECGDRTYPAVDEAPCTEVSDGFCEVAELASYETTDGACLRFGGASYDHLFYRGTKVVDVPVQVELDGDELLLSGGAVGRVLHIRRRARRDRTRVEVHALPTDGSALRAAWRVDGGEPADAGRAMIAEELTALGLTEPERDAFLRAWGEHLFGRERGAERSDPVQSGHAPQALEPMGDALLYFLPAGALPSVAELRFDPEPDAVRRALAVLVDLGPAPGRAGRIDPATVADPCAADPSACLGLTGLRPSAQPQGAAPGPRVRVHRPTVQGSLPTDIVHRVVRRQLALFRSCRENHASSGSVEGRVEVRFVVANDGSTAQANATENTTGEPALATCIVAALRRTTFPRPEGGGIAIITQPITFAPR